MFEATFEYQDPHYQRHEGLPDFFGSMVSEIVTSVDTVLAIDSNDGQELI